MAETHADYRPDQFKSADKMCDLVMKGGITSGIVYPRAILELAQAYRFRSIGGASAGAIASAFAAAAEFGRQSGDPQASSAWRNGATRFRTSCTGCFSPPGR